MAAISVRGLGKQYRLGASRHNTLRDHLASLWRRGEKPQPKEFWALRDVSFDVQPGEVLGVIGRNGAGKSTLLKVLSQITDPTEGEVRIRGRVGSLLEVGTGFHPELSGRENIYMSGAILGMTRREIRSKFDEIAAFAEVDQFLDTPVKHYSSGMYVRLAFAVAAHLEPEILLVDEVLAVGDAAFQKKCLGKMEGVAKHGRTVLFVSHNMIAVQNLCTRAVWLAEGKLHADGAPAEIVPRYLKDLTGDVPEKVWPDDASAPGDDKVRLRRISIRPRDGAPGDHLTTGTPLIAEVEFFNHTPGAVIGTALRFVTEHGIIAFVTSSNHCADTAGRPLQRGLVRTVCHVPPDLLNIGGYTLTLLVVQDGGTVLQMHEEIIAFEVKEYARRHGGWQGRYAGVVHPQLTWELHA